MRNPPSERLNISSVKGQSHSGIRVEDENTVECDSDMGIALATIACTFNEHQANRKLNVGVQNVVMHTLNQAMKKWGESASDAALKEMKQLPDRKCFVPMHADAVSDDERKRAMQSLLFLVEKHDGTMKARHCANGSVQRNWISSEDTASPTVHTQSVLLTGAIDAEERRDVAVSDVPNAFIQTECQERDDDGNRMIMKIRGVLVDILCNVDPSCEEFIVVERGEKALCAHML